MTKPLLSLAGLILWAGALAAAPEARTLVVCAPGYPGTTEEAQPVMDAFASAAEAEAGWSEGSLGAVYINRLEEGVERLKGDDVVAVLVPIPFWAEYHEELKLERMLRIVQEEGSEEVWSLAAKKGRVSSPASLEEWELAGMPGYAPAFVRQLLEKWGALPESTQIRFTSRVLGALRRAARGEDVAVLLDRAQAKALPALPFGAELEVIHTADPVPASFLCTVGDPTDDQKTLSLLAALLHLHEDERFQEALADMRVKRFEAFHPDLRKKGEEEAEVPAP
jgi:hypothetical protein